MCVFNAPSPPPAPPPAPTIDEEQAALDEDNAKRAEKARQSRAFGRQDTILGGLSLGREPTSRVNTLLGN